MNEQLLSMMHSTLFMATPLIFAAMGGLMSERSGVVNIALEGFMIAGTVSAASVAHFTHSPWLGALMAIVAGAALAVIYGFSVIQLKTDQIVAGTAINLFAMGAAPLTTKALFDSTGHSPQLELTDRFQIAPVFAAFTLVILLHFWTKRTRAGLWQGFAGEHPEALSTAGISVRAVRWWSVAASGALAGLGGMTLSTFLSSSYSRDMTAGRGFMALAALIFGKWRPIPTLLACLFFGFTDALSIRLQGVALFGGEPVPVQFIQILPYGITVFVLAGFVGRSRAPSKLGIPWMLALAALGTAFTGCQRPAQSRKMAAVTAPSASEEQQGNLVLLREMFAVVALAPHPAQEIFQPRANAVAQGASLEGIYNGFVQSAQYRAAEKGPAASPGTVDAFARALATLQLKAPSPWRMSRHAPDPAGEIVRPTGESSKDAAKSAGGWAEHDAALATRDEAKLTEFYRRAFGRSSFYTLKRVLGEAALHLLDPVGPGTPAIFADVSVEWNAWIRDAGTPARASRDAKFHREWAKSASADRVRWELLSRAHRLLNEAEKQKTGGE